MDATQDTKQKYLINCQDGANNVERATISFILAVTASKTCETAVFLTSDASGICIKGGTDKLVAKGYEPLRDLVTAFRTNGGKMWLCPACATAKGIAQSDLDDGVEIAGAARTMAFLESGARVLA